MSGVERRHDPPGDKARKLQTEKFALVYQDDEFGADVRCGYQKAVKELGLNSVSEIAFKRGTKDFSAEMLSLKRAGVRPSSRPAASSPSTRC